MNESKRCVYLDVLKCIAMLCVCLYHFPLMAPDSADLLTGGVLFSRYLRGLNAVCVPLFMMVNGALLMNARFDAKRHAMRIVKLVAGVYVWYGITQVIGHLARDGAAYVMDNLAGMAYSALYLYEYDGITLTHLWFVQMLSAMYLLLPLLRAAASTTDAQLKKGFGLFVLAMGVLCFALRDFAHVQSVLPGLKYLDLSCVETMNPLRGNYGGMIVYFLLGGWLHERREEMKRLPVFVPELLLIVGSVVLFGEFVIMTKRTGAMYDIVYYGYTCLPTLCMSAGAFLLCMRYADKLPKAGKRLASFVGRNTLAIYYLHWIFGLVFVQGRTLAMNLPANLVKAALMVLLGALLGEGMRRVPLLRHLV